MNENIYSWEFDDKRDRWTLWYIIALSIVLWLSIWWFFTKQYWMSFIVLLISGLAYFAENNSEDIVKVNINNLWISIAWSLFNYSSINSFQIVYKLEEPILLRLNLNKKWIRNIDVKINNYNIEEIQNILIEFIKEKEKVELTVSEKIIKKLKL